MDNPGTRAVFGTRHRQKTNKTKNIAQKTNKSRGPHQQPGAEPICSLMVSSCAWFLSETGRVTPIVKSGRSIVCERGNKRIQRSIGISEMDIS
jgi:hypothetical protein